MAAARVVLGALVVSAESVVAATTRVLAAALELVALVAVVAKYGNCLVAGQAAAGMRLLAVTLRNSGISFFSMLLVSRLF